MSKDYYHSIDQGFIGSGAPMMPQQRNKLEGAFPAPEENVHAKFAQKSQEGTFENLLVTEDVKKEIEEGDKLKIVYFKPAENGYYSMNYQWPEYGYSKELGRSFEIRKNLNRLMKALAQNCFDEKGEFDYDRGYDFTDEICDNFNQISLGSKNTEECLENLALSLGIDQQNKEEFQSFKDFAITHSNVLGPQGLFFKDSLIHFKIGKGALYERPVAKTEEEANMLEGFTKDLYASIQELKQISEIDPATHREMITRTECSGSTRLFMAINSSAAEYYEQNKTSEEKEIENYYQMAEDYYKETQLNALNASLKNVTGNTPEDIRTLDEVNKKIKQYNDKEFVRQKFQHLNSHEKDQYFNIIANNHNLEDEFVDKLQNHITNPQGEMVSCIIKEYEETMCLTHDILKNIMPEKQPKVENSQNYGGYIYGDVKKLYNAFVNAEIISGLNIHPEIYLEWKKDGKIPADKLRTFCDDLGIENCLATYEEKLKNLKPEEVPAELREGYEEECRRCSEQAIKQVENPHMLKKLSDEIAYKQMDLAEQNYSRKYDFHYGYSPVSFFHKDQFGNRTKLSLTAEAFAPETTELGPHFGITSSVAKGVYHNKGNLNDQFNQYYLQDKENESKKYTLLVNSTKTTLEDSPYPPKLTDNEISYLSAHFDSPKRNLEKEEQLLNKLFQDSEKNYNETGRMVLGSCFAKDSPTNLRSLIDEHDGIFVRSSQEYKDLKESIKAMQNKELSSPKLQQALATVQENCEKYLRTHPDDDPHNSKLRNQRIANVKEIQKAVKEQLLTLQHAEKQYTNSGLLYNNFLLEKSKEMSKENRFEKAKANRERVNQLMEKQAAKRQQPQKQEPQNRARSHSLTQPKKEQSEPILGRNSF